MPKYYVTPFAENSANRTAIPNDTQVDQTISYQQGWTPTYETSYFVDRKYSNDVLYDATANLQFWQQNNYPAYITATDNEGVAYPYGALNIVKYSGQTYQSLISPNTQLPTNPTAWTLIDRPFDTSMWIKGVSFEGTVINGDVVAYNHNTQLYQKAVANGSYLSYAVGVADITNNRILNKGIYSGLSGLTPGTLYYLTNVVANAGQIVPTPPDNQFNNVIIGSAQSSSSIFIDVEQSQKLNTAKHLAQVTNSTALTYTNGTSTNTTSYQKIPFNTVVVDNASLFNTATNKFVIPSDGQYLITLSVSAIFDDFFGPFNLISLSVDVQVNYSGTRETAYPSIFSGDSVSDVELSDTLVGFQFPTGLSFSRVLSLSAGDTLEAFCMFSLTNSSVTIPISTANAFCVSKYN